MILFVNGSTSMLEAGMRIDRAGCSCAAGHSHSVLLNPWSPVIQQETRRSGVFFEENSPDLLISCFSVSVEKDLLNS
jgi:hypothetical protein